MILGRKNLDADWTAYTAKLDQLGVERFVELVALYAAGGQN